MADLIEPSLLPPPLRRDLNMRALETVIARLSAIDLTPLVIADVDNVPASLLPHLAEQLNVLGDAGWDMATTEAAQRTLIKEAIALHKLKGTRYAVERALDILGVVALIIEWWQREPQGTPHTFSVSVSLKDQPVDAAAIDAARIEQIRRAVTFWKPVRSHFTMTVGYDKGAELKTRIAAVFVATQVLSSSGVARPYTPGASSAVRAVSIVVPTQLLITGSPMR
jgi:phage tail P2-like protein